MALGRDALTTHFEFDRCPVVWRHRIWGATEYAPETKNGIFFFGEEGTVFAADQSWTVLSNRKDAEPVVHQAPAELGTLHMANFLDAVRTGGKASCQIADAFRSTATVQLGMISYETGSRVVWNENTEQILGNEPASRLLKREYRKPYEHPYPG